MDDTSPALVLGGTGSFGGAMARELSQRGRPVRLLARNPARAEAALAGLSGIDVQPGDVLDATQVKAAASGCDLIVHGVNYPYDKWVPYMHTATLNVTGRDVHEGRYALTRDTYGGWRLDGDTLEAAAAAADTAEVTANLGDMSRDIIDYLNEMGEATPKQIADALGYPHDQVKTKLRSLTESERIANPTRGKYTPLPTSATTTATFTTSDDSEPDKVAKVAEVVPTESSAGYDS